MTFIDTNVLVYYVDERYPGKCRIASGIVASAIDSPDYLISAQVLNEFANVAVKKLSMPEDEASEYVREFMQIKTVDQSADWTCSALQIKKQLGIQFFDSLIIAAAVANGCDTILTEDLADGHVYCGVKAVNPFK